MSKNRGFKRLAGKTIQSVNTDAINEVLLVDEDGHSYLIEAAQASNGIPVITLKKLKHNGYPVLENKLRPLARPKQKAAGHHFPFPPVEDPSYD